MLMRSAPAALVPCSTASLPPQAETQRTARRWSTGGCVRERTGGTSEVGSLVGTVSPPCIVPTVRRERQAGAWRAGYRHRDRCPRYNRRSPGEESQRYDHCERRRHGLRRGRYRCRPGRGAGPRSLPLTKPSHVLVLDAGPISHLKGRAFWSKSVQIEDAPVFQGVIGSHFMRALREWMASRPVREVTIGGRNPAHRYRVPSLATCSQLRALAMPSQRSLRWKHRSCRSAPERPIKRTQFRARTVVVASGFDDVWPDIEVNEQAERLYQRYRTVFRFAGNRHGWHVCIRCDGHLAY